MRISIEKLEAAGYQVDMDIKRGIMEIHPENPLQLDWSFMREQFKSAGIDEFAADCGMDAFHIEVEMHQILKACR